MSALAIANFSDEIGDDPKRFGEKGLYITRFEFSEKSIREYLFDF